MAALIVEGGGGGSMSALCRVDFVCGDVGGRKEKGHRLFVLHGTFVVKNVKLGLTSAMTVQTCVTLRPM